MFMDRLAAAYVRGMANLGEIASLPHELAECPLENLSYEQSEQLIEIGKKAELRMYHFKEKEDLPRVRNVLGILKGIGPETLLDVGSGRGVFLFPFLREFPWVPVTSVDILPHRVQMMQAICAGGVDQLDARLQDFTRWECPENAFDVVTLLEVLEHIEDVESAVRAAVRLARRCIILSVPSKPDDNPEHIHLLTKDLLTDLFAKTGEHTLHFGGVNGHLILTVILNKE